MKISISDQARQRYGDALMQALAERAIEKWQAQSQPYLHSVYSGDSPGDIFVLTSKDTCDVMLTVESPEAHAIRALREKVGPTPLIVITTEKR